MTTLPAIQRLRRHTQNCVDQYTDKSDPEAKRTEGWLQALDYIAQNYILKKRDENGIS